MAYALIARTASIAALMLWRNKTRYTRYVSWKRACMATCARPCPRRSATTCSARHPPSSAAPSLPGTTSRIMLIATNSWCNSFLRAAVRAAGRSREPWRRAQTPIRRSFVRLTRTALTHARPWLYLHRGVDVVAIATLPKNASILPPKDIANATLRLPIFSAACRRPALAQP